MHGLQWDGEGLRIFAGLPAVDRRLFIPDDIWVHVEVPFEQWHPHLQETHDRAEGLVERKAVSRADDPGEWERWVESDDSIVTQIQGEWASSSSSAPWVMARMIEALRLKPGMRVLEIGTGTGFNAACLAALGAEVVSVEIDPDIAEHARARLRAAGCPEVQVVTGDGEFGHRERAPYDRVIATAAAHTIPYPWVAQTRNGGLIVVPYTGEGHRAALLVLAVHDGVATGGVEGEAAFMPLRGQKLPQTVLQSIESRDRLRIEVTESGQGITDR